MTPEKLTFVLLGLLLTVSFANAYYVDPIPSGTDAFFINETVKIGGTLHGPLNADYSHSDAEIIISKDGIEVGRIGFTEPDCTYVNLTTFSECRFIAHKEFDAEGTYDVKITANYDNLTITNVTRVKISGTRPSYRGMIVSTRAKNSLWMSGGCISNEPCTLRTFVVLPQDLNFDSIVLGSELYEVNKIVINESLRAVVGTHGETMPLTTYELGNKVPINYAYKAVGECEINEEAKTKACFFETSPFSLPQRECLKVTYKDSFTHTWTEENTENSSCHYLFTNATYSDENNSLDANYFAPLSIDSIGSWEGKVTAIIAEKLITEQKLMDNLKELKKTDRKPVHRATGTKRVKLFSIIPLEMTVTANFDVQTNETSDVNYPWWKFLTTE